MNVARPTRPLARLAVAAIAGLLATAPAVSQTYEFCLKVDDYLKLYGVDSAAGPCVDWPEPVPEGAKIALCRDSSPKGWRLEVSGPGAPQGASIPVSAVRVRGALPIVYSSEVQGTEEAGLHIYTLIDLELGAGEPRMELLKVISPRCRDTEMTPAADVLASSDWVEGPQSRRDK